MSDEFSIKRVGATAPDYNFQPMQAQQQNQAIAESVKASTTVLEVDKKAEAKKAETKREEERNKKEKPSLNLASVDLQFEVNNDTSEVTLKIVDRESKEILRTIPQSNFSQLSVAELFNLYT